MKPISIVSTLTITILSFVLLSCTKENISLAELQAGKWEVEKIKKAGDSSFRKAKNSYFLEFTTDNDIRTRLDKNTCWGAYELIDNENIRISDFSCTYLCCDTEYASDFSRLIRFTTKYYKRDNKLLLEGEGEVVLKKVE